MEHVVRLVADWAAHAKVRLHRRCTQLSRLSPKLVSKAPRRAANDEQLSFGGRSAPLTLPLIDPSQKV